MSIYALVDCNNFYASCERVFNPRLENKPIIVLSNNDGCVIARSNEAKVLGIKMGVPFFEIANFCRSKQVYVFSSNFVLYGDMSHRVMQVLQQTCPEVEIYSIDEAFLDLTTLPAQNILTHTAYLRRIIKQWVGIPVSIGIAPSKTLAKIANTLAKKQDKIVNLCDPIIRQQVLDSFPVEDIWGVGRKLAVRLQALNIHTAAQLVNAPVALIRKRFNIVMLQIQAELQGYSCFTLEEQPAAAKSLISSRSFGTTIREIDELKSAITYHASRIALRLRNQQLITPLVQIFCYSSRFQGDRRQSSSIVIPLSHASNDTTMLVAAALSGIDALYQPDVYYKKAGLMVFNLQSATHGVIDLFSANEFNKNAEKLSIILDKINKKMGKNAVFLAPLALGNKKWVSVREKRSPRYSTNWSELLEVKA
ncbi:MAG: Y-family DNA polymerase [Gammaproteobacteria bacterium]